MSVPKYSIRGVQDVLEVFEDRVTITPAGVLGFLNKGLKGTKTIPYTSISAVQFREPGMLVNGYIQFTLPGGNESRKGVMGATQDENTVMLAKHKNPDAVKIKDYIEAQIKAANSPKNSVTPSLSDQLAQLSQLRNQGVLTEAEFLAAKAKLLG